MVKRAWMLLMLAAMGLQLSCIQELDPKSLVKDLRILGIRAEPPELIDDPLPGSVRFEALALDPRQEEPFELELTWEFCPLESSDFCRDYEEKLASDVPALPSLDLGGGGTLTIPGYPDCPVSPGTEQGLQSVASTLAQLTSPGALDAFRGETVGDAYVLSTGQQVQSVNLEVLTSVAADLQACGVSTPSVSLPQETSNLHLYHFMVNPLESLLGVWPTVVLTAKSKSETLVAQKRLPVRFRHPSTPLRLVQTLSPDFNLGLNLCAPGGDGSDCLSVNARAPNQNPVFEAINIREGDLAGPGPFTPYWSRADLPDPRELPPWEVVANEGIRVQPVFTEASSEAYERFVVDPNTLQMAVTQEQEKISVSWFATDGLFKEELTWVEGTITLDTGWRAPAEAGEVTMFMVARDQRGGTAWKAIRIAVVNP